MSYKVTKQYGRGPESACAEFKELTDAQFFIDKKLPEEAALGSAVTYRIMDGMDIISEHDASKVRVEAGVSSGSAGAKGSGSSFQPTPFNTAPRPAGSPQKWLKDDEDEKKR